MTWRESETATTIPRRFEEQARLHPLKPAIAGTSWQPGFRELDAAANGIAAAILDRCGEGGGRIALLMRHDAPLIAAILGALKAGRAVVVLGQSDPPRRLAEVREDVGPELTVADGRHRKLALRAGCSTDELLILGDEPPAGAASGVDGAPEDLASLLYTAGSTGRPKGVMQTHRTALHNVLRQTNALGVGSEDRIAVLASLSGGQGFTTTWLALLNGATLCPFAAMERGVTGLAEWLARNEVTVLVSTSSLFRQFVRRLEGRELPGIRLVRLAGEPVRGTDFKDFRRHFSRDCVFANTLSASEAGHVAGYSLRADAEPPEGHMPVGRPGEGIDLRLVDDAGAQVAPGEVGEIVVRSDYLSPGYWADEALTSRRFVDDGSGRSFRSGDLGRLSDDGLLTLVGRSDSMVKVRGFRVELSEVEAVLSARPEVEAAAVCARPTRAGQRLEAYVSTAAGHAPDAGALRQALRAALPDHAVPTAFAFVDALPVDPNGKVDRRRLLEMEPQTGGGGRAEPPRTETEQLLCRIWSVALERDGVGRDDDFLELGGDSLTAAVIAANVNDVLGVELELSAFTERPTVARLAALIDELLTKSDAGDRSRLVRVSRAEPLQMSFMQERTWRYSRTPEESASWTVASGFRIRGALDLERFRRAVELVVRRQEVLRTTYHERDGRPVQVVHQPEPVALPLIDLSSSAEPQARAGELLAAEGRERFDLERLPQLRLRLARLAGDEHWLIRSSHHINSDNRSWGVFLEELGAAYTADLLEEKPLGYADFAAWERDAFRPDGQRYMDDIAWWRRALDGAPPRTPLPFSRSTPKDGADPSEGVVWFGQDPEVSRELETLARAAGATYFMVRVAAFAALLAHQAGRKDLLIGTYATTRQPVETQDMFGFFSNPVALRLRFEGDPRFRDWLATVRDAVLDMSPHSQVPYGELVEELRKGGTEPPDLQAIFSAWGTLPPARFGGIEVTPLRRAFSHMPWGFTIQLDPHWEAERCLAAFDARIHDPAAVRSFVDRYLLLLGDVSAEPDRPLSELLPRRPPPFRRLLRRALAQPRA